MRSLFAGALLAVAAACGSEPTLPKPANTLVVIPTWLVMGLGMTRQLSGSVIDASGVPVAGAMIGFRSSDLTRATVTSDGLVTYVGEGQAEIRANSDELLAVVPYTGLRVGHPLGTTSTSSRLPGDGQGDGPFGVAVDGEGRIFISQTNSGRVASDQYPVTGFTTRDLGGSPTAITLLAGGLPWSRRPGPTPTTRA